MAKISNTEIYNPDSNLSRGDNWVGTDEITKKTKTYYVGTLSDFISEQIEFGVGSTLRENAVINGNYYNIPGTYDYFVWADKYVIDNVVYNTYISDTVTLSPADADADIDRVDVIVINSNGTFSVVEGASSVNPEKPFVNPETQVEMTFVIVEGTTTAPTNVVTTPVYNENLLAVGGEWDSSIVGGGISKTATIEPFSGTTHISFTNTSGNANYINFGASTPALKQNYEKLVIAVKLVSGSNQGFAIILNETNGAVNQWIYIADGDYGFDASNQSSYQIITIPASDINFSSINLLYLFCTNGGVMYFDKIEFQSGNPTNTNEVDRTSQLINDGSDGTSPFVMLKDLPALGGGISYPIITIAGRPWQLRKTVNLTDSTKATTLEINDIIAGTRSAGRYELLLYNGGSIIEFDNNYTPITGI